MTYTTFLEIVDGEWDESYATKGILGMVDTYPFNMVQYGVLFDQITWGFLPMGPSEKIAADMTGDIFNAYFVGTTIAEIKAQIKALKELSLRWKGTPNSDVYFRLHFDAGQVDFRPENIFQMTNTWRLAIGSVLASRSGEVIAS